MNRTDYSKDAQLTATEIDDMDTYSYAMLGTKHSMLGEHETGINDGRMRLPTRYDVSKVYEKGRWVHSSEGIDFSDDFQWQITYSFPSTLRSNITSTGVEYGGRTVTYRRLYLILCEHFNGGVYFIDDYFRNIYPSTVKKDVDKKLEKLKSTLVNLATATLGEARADSRGNLDRRYKVNRGKKALLNGYEAFAEAWEDSEGIIVASMIKTDIIDCLMTGRIPLKHMDKVSTMRVRMKAGLSAQPTFFATARLIESLQLFVKLGGNGEWRTEQGILV